MSFTPIDVDPDNPKTWERLLDELRELKAQNASLRESAAKNKGQGLARANDELRRANRALKALSRCKEAMIRAGDEAVLLNDVCRIIVDVGGYRLAWIGYIENDGARTVRPAARSGYDEGYVDSLKIALEDPVRGNGPTGICLKTGKPYVSRDVRSDKEMRRWRKEALKRGYLSTLNLPIVHEKRVIGALAIYSGTVDAFDEEKRGLLFELAQTLAYGITAIRDRAGRIRAEDELKRANEELEMRIGERTKKLRESEANLARAQRIAHLGNWSWDTKSDWVEGSLEFIRMFGFEGREHVTYDDVIATLHPDDRGPVSRAVRAAISGTAPYNVDYRVVKPDGERVVHADGEVVRDEAGRPVQMFGTAQDITEQKRIEKELARSRDALEERVRERTSELRRMNVELESRILERNMAEESARLAYAYNRSLIEASLDPLVTISPDGKVTDVNKATESVTGYPREHLIGTDFSDYFTEPEKAKEGYLTAFNEGPVKDYPLQVRRRDGHVTPVIYNASVYRDEAGKVIGVFAAARDITDLRRMEEELRMSRDDLEAKVEQRTKELSETRDYLESLIAYANAPIIVWSPAFIVTQFNRAFERLSGYEAGEVVGKGLKMLFPPESVDEPLGGIRSTLTGERLESVEIPILRKDGSVRIALWNSANINGQSGDLLATIAQGQDITERKQAEAELAKAKMLVELYLDLMGHDINNYNQVATGYLELLNGMLQGQELKALAAKPMEAIASSTRLIENVRKLQKASASEFKAHAVDLDEVLTGLRAEYSEAPGKVVRIRYSRCRGCQVMANDLVKDVFSNLIGNAIKHSGGREPIEVAIRLARMDGGGKKYCRVDIEDNGPGIPDMLKSKLFHRFQRGDTKARGKGLGLYLVRTLVEVYHGKVWVEDRVMGDHTKGARFVVILPAVEK